MFRELGRTGLKVASLGFGSFKIGRNRGVKYPEQYDLPPDAEADLLLNQVLDLGCNLIDTAPAYGLSEERIGRAISHRRSEFVLSTKVGETFDHNGSHYDFRATTIENSLQLSRERLKSDVLDLVLLHVPADDVAVLQQTDAVETLIKARQAGSIRAIGLSAKTIAAARLAFAWADVLMLEYHALDTSFGEIMQTAHDQRIGILVKKGLAAGTIPPDIAIPFVLQNQAVDSLVIGGLNFCHFQSNWQLASQSRQTGRC